MPRVERKFTAVYKKSGKWYLAWIEEVPGVNTQGRTLKEVKENLKDALVLVIEANRLLSRKDSGRGAVREPIAVSI